MLEILKMIANYKEAGVALFFAMLFYLDFRKKVISLDKTISNELVHTIKEQGKTIKKDAENTERVEKAIDRLDNTIGRFIDKI